MLLTPIFLEAQYYNPYYDPAYNQMNEEEIEKRKELLGRALFYSTAIRIFCWIDGVFLFFWALFAWPFIFPLLLVILGYYGAKYYRPALLTMYTVYILGEMAVRLYWLIKPMDDSLGFRILSSLALLINLYIFYITVSLVYYILKLNPTELMILRDLTNLWYGESVIIIQAFPYYNGVGVGNPGPKNINIEPARSSTTSSVGSTTTTASNTANPADANINPSNPPYRSL
jgi:hypothetical protein